jgi:hypothetical protein
MKCKGKFKYRGLIQRKAGEFINSRGEKIKYDASYEIKVDEQTEEGNFERRFKTPIDSPLVPVLSKVPLYDEIVIEFQIQMFGTNVKLIPIAIVQ